MILSRFDNPQQFVEQVSSFLMADEAENNLMIGIANRLASIGVVERSDKDHPIFLGCVTSDSQVLGAALMTPPYNLILTRTPEPAIAFLAECIHQSGISLPGLLAPKEPAELFADQTHTIREPRERVLQHIEAGSLCLWTDPDPVAMALAGAITPNCRRIGGVYTPPDRRNHGYASAVVAELSQSILESGKRFSFLFTDLANPTANSIYAKIGYLPVSDYAEYRFIASGRN